MLIFSSSSWWHLKCFWKKLLRTLLIYLLSTKSSPINYSCCVLCMTVAFVPVKAAFVFFFILDMFYLVLPILWEVQQLLPTNTLLSSAFPFCFLYTPKDWAKKGRDNVLKSLWYLVVTLPCVDDKEHYLNVNFSQPVIADFSLDWYDATLKIFNADFSACFSWLHWY